MFYKGILSSLLTSHGVNDHDDHQLIEMTPEHKFIAQSIHKVPEHNHSFEQNFWHLPSLPNPLKMVKELASWGTVKLIDESGNELDTSFGHYESQETNPLFKWFEEKTMKYIAYEAAKKKFYLQDDYSSRRKCSVMSLFTSEQ